MPIDPGGILAAAPRTDTIQIPGRAPLPVTLLTGFLGAGKTTLLNRILSGDHGLRVGVLVNDFGAINIDAELIEGIEENTISLTNGCICCEIREDLVTSLELMLKRGDAIDYVILEASGVSDPESIVMTFLDRRYEKLLKLDSITCIVDAEAVFAHADNPAITSLKFRQIANADLVILNKVDLVTPTHVEVIHDWINQQLKRIRVIEATRCDVPLDILLAVGRFDPECIIDNSAVHAESACEHDETGHVHAAGEMFETWSFNSDRPFSLEALAHMVRRELPASVYRCKGIVYVDTKPDHRMALQAVGRRVEISVLDAWADRSRCSKIVAIGRGLDPDALTAQFSKCLVGPLQ